MRYAIVSDLHANLQAWNAVLLDIRSVGVDEILCLGDVIGYGPNPAEVLESVHRNVDHFVLGNHDAVLCNKMNPELFHETARDIIEWTAQQLSPDAVRFLSEFPLTLAGENFRCAHGDFSAPAAFHYIFDPADALPSWQSVEETVLFVGHTHEPAIFLLGESGTPRGLSARDFIVEGNRRFLVNVGSVGQPRDKEARASYVLYDLDEQTVCWRRIPFDLDAYREALHRQGVSDAPSHFLRYDPRTDSQPLRDSINFSPAKSAEEQAQNVLEVAELDQLQKRVQRWKTVATAAIAGGIMLTAGAGVAWHRYTSRQLVIPARQSRLTLDPAPLPIAARNNLPIEDKANLLPLVATGSPPEVPLQHWSLHLADKRSQQVELIHPPDGPVLQVYSRKADAPIRITSAPVTVSPSMRFRLYVEMDVREVVSGDLTCYAVLESATPPHQILDDKFTIKRAEWDLRNGWHRAVKTFPESHQQFPETTRVRFELRGSFEGTIRIREAGLGRIE